MTKGEKITCFVLFFVLTPIVLSFADFTKVIPWQETKSSPIRLQPQQWATDNCAYAYNREVREEKESFETCQIKEFKVQNFSNKIKLIVGSQNTSCSYSFDNAVNEYHACKDFLKNSEYRVGQKVRLPASLPYDKDCEAVIEKKDWSTGYEKGPYVALSISCKNLSEKRKETVSIKELKQ